MKIDKKQFTERDLEAFRKAGAMGGAAAKGEKKARWGEQNGRYKAKKKKK